MKGLFITIVIALLLAACDQPPPQPVTTASTVKAKVMTIVSGAIREDYETTGSLIADDRVDIASRIMGFIRTVNVHEGSKVNEGQLLLTIDPTEIQAQLAEAEARVTQSRAQRLEAESDLNRYKTLFAEKMISADRYHKAELAFNLAQGETKASEATLDRIKVQMQYASIRSPVSGIIVARHKQAGDIATPGAALLTIENPDNVVVRTFVKEELIQHINIGDIVKVIIDAAGISNTGTVTQIVPSAELNTHSYLVKISLNSQSDARAGMFARILFDMGHSEGLVIPKSSVINRADLNGVYIVDTNNIAHYRLIRLGRQLNTDVEILSGIKAGNRIITEKPELIRSGDHIQPIQSPAS